MRDECFIRGNVPMTKSEVRAISLSKLELEFECESQNEVVLYDVGAGTGSVAVEAALGGRCRHVYAIERTLEGQELIQSNAKKWGVESKITLVKGEAPEAFSGLEKPTHAFIGGSGGHMEEILDTLFRLNPEIRIVINVITLESLSKLTCFLDRYHIKADISMVSISKTREVGRYHLLNGQNPVVVAAFGGKEDRRENISL